MESRAVTSITLWYGNGKNHLLIERENRTAGYQPSDGAARKVSSLINWANNQGKCKVRPFLGNGVGWVAEFYRE